MEIKEFTIQVTALRPVLMKHAQPISGADCSAEDVVQETLLRLWQQRKELDRHPNVKALALTIERNIMRDVWRRRSNYQLSIANYQLSVSNSQLEEARSDLEIVGWIVEHLPPLQQQIFRMKEMEGYDKTDIIGITGCTEESLRQNLSRARRRIREEFIRITAEKGKR